MVTATRTTVNGRTAVVVPASNGDDLPFTMAMVPVSMLRIDPHYQRSLDDRHTLNIAENFDPMLFKAIDVSLRADGLYYVMDGQHRYSAVVLREAPSEVPAHIYRDLTPRQEAEIFDRQDEGKKKLRPENKFKSRLFRGEPIALEIKRIVEVAGFGLAMGGAAKGEIAAVAALERIHTGYRDDMLATTLALVRDCWGIDAEDLTGNVVEGVAAFVYKYGKTAPPFDRKLLVRRASVVPPKQLNAKGNEIKVLLGGGMPHGVARALLTLYNSGLSSNRLQAWDAK